MPYQMSDMAASTTVARVRVVTNRDATAQCTASAVHCHENSRPGGWLHRAMCSPSTLSSIGEVSAALPKDAVLQRGEFSILEIMAAPKVGMTTSWRTRFSTLGVFQNEGY
jgi:hypothetical protein